MARYNRQCSYLELCR